MRVAMVTLHTSPWDAPGTHDAGGLNVSVGELSTALVKLGASVTCVARAAQGNPAPEPNLGGINRREIASLSPHLSKTELEQHLDAAAEELAALLTDFDVVHSHYWLSSVAVERARERIRVAGEHSPAHVMTLHTNAIQKDSLPSTESAREAGTTPRAVAERELLAAVPVIASSESEAALLTQHASSLAAPLTVITPGVDADLFSPSAATRDEPNITFCVVGRVQPFKGQDFALEVFAQYLRRTHSNARLIVVGEHTPDAEDFAQELRARASALNISDRVEFLGALDRAQVARVLAESTVTIIPSISETFGLVALESAASGTPVLAPATGGLTESVQDEVSGMLVRSRDAVEWATALAELTEQTAPLSELSTSAREWALDHSWEKAASRHFELYEALTRAD